MSYLNVSRWNTETPLDLPAETHSHTHAQTHNPFNLLLTLFYAASHPSPTQVRLFTSVNLLSVETAVVKHSLALSSRLPLDVIATDMLINKTENGIKVHPACRCCLDLKSSFKSKLQILPVVMFIAFVIIKNAIFKMI